MNSKFESLVDAATEMEGIEIDLSKVKIILETLTQSTCPECGKSGMCKHRIVR